MNNFKNIIADLKATFEIDPPIDISPFFDNDGEKWLFKLIESIHRDTFEDNYRIVLYFDKDDYFYENHVGLLVEKLQQIVLEVDISNYFIILISTENIVRDDLALVCDQYSTDGLNITHIQCDDVNAKFNPLVDNHDTFCIKPFMHLHINTEGGIAPCCSGATIAHVNDGTINDIINCDEFNTIRRNMISNKKSKECSYCYAMERNGSHSMRHSANIRFKDYIDDAVHSINDDGTIDDFNMVSVDIRLSNVCNFKCRICSGLFSSKIQKENSIELISDTQYDILSPYKRDEVLSKILPSIEDVEYFYFAGGEPLIIKEHYVILDRLIELHKYDVRLYYNTNISQLRYRDKDIIEYWNKFTNIKVGISFDDSGDGAEYSRNGTIWDEVERNYLTIREECPHVKVNITSTYSIYNAFNLMKFQYDWIINKKIQVEDLSFNVLTDPQHLSIQLFPNVFKEKLNTLIINHIDFLRGYNADDLIITWENAMTFLNSNDYSFKLNDFFEYNDILDNRRRESFGDVYPELKYLQNCI